MTGDASMAHRRRLISRIAGELGRFPTQRLASITLGLPQPRISDLMNEKVELFSNDRLIEILDLLGIDVVPEMRERADRPQYASPHRS